MLKKDFPPRFLVLVTIIVMILGFFLFNQRNQSLSTILDSKTQASPLIESVDKVSILSKPSCSINISTIDLGSNVLRLVYSYDSNGSNTYMSEAQWDFNGDGRWDTPMSLYNGDVIHQFKVGKYTVKLRVKANDGKITEPCTKLITIPVK